MWSNREDLFIPCCPDSFFDCVHLIPLPYFRLPFGQIKQNKIPGKSRNASSRDPTTTSYNFYLAGVARSRWLFYVAPRHHSRCMESRWRLLGFALVLLLFWCFITEWCHTHDENVLTRQSNKRDTPVGRMRRLDRGVSRSALCGFLLKCEARSSRHQHHDHYVCRNNMKNSEVQALAPFNSVSWNRTIYKWPSLWSSSSCSAEMNESFSYYRIHFESLPLWNSESRNRIRRIEVIDL